MSRVRTELEFDEELLHQAAELGERTGHSRDEVIETAVRQHLVAISVPRLIEEVQARSTYGHDQVVAVAQAQAEANKVEREALTPP